MIGLKTTIDIDYIPPDQYPDYAPPDYRAASSVTLHCRTEGASGSVRYRWSSTCSSCFTSSSSSSSISESILKSRDRGYHTCTATDSNGNIGNDTIQMNIVGELIIFLYCGLCGHPQLYHNNYVEYCRCWSLCVTNTEIRWKTSSPAQQYISQHLLRNLQ